MRVILFVLILAVLALIAAVATGFLDITQTRSAKAPDVRVDRSGVSAKGGQAPAFDIETGSVAVGSEPRNVAVPAVKVVPPEQGNTATNQAR